MNKSRTLLGESPPMVTLRDKICRAAASDCLVLLEGETGTGKELVAKELHRLSRRAAMPYKAINCGAIADNLLESELFGHVRGAFTGAHRDHEGLFLQANDGTLFLDEIGEMPLLVQPTLLRVLEQPHVTPVGGNHPREINVRVVAASNRNLSNEVKAGRFREDLFYRLKVVSLALPPLRARGDDVLLLARHFVAQYCVQMRLPSRSFASDALQALQSYAWPGNVRELENRITNALVMYDSQQISAADLDLPTTGLLGPGGIPPGASEASRQWTTSGLARMAATFVSEPGRGKARKTRDKIAKHFAVCLQDVPRSLRTVVRLAKALADAARFVSEIRRCCASGAFAPAADVLVAIERDWPSLLSDADSQIVCDPVFTRPDTASRADLERMSVAEREVQYSVFAGLRGRFPIPVGHPKDRSWQETLQKTNAIDLAPFNTLLRHLDLSEYCLPEVPMDPQEYDSVRARKDEMVKTAASRLFSAEPDTPLLTKLDAVYDYLSCANVKKPKGESWVAVVPGYRGTDRARVAAEHLARGEVACVCLMGNSPAYDKDKAQVGLPESLAMLVWLTEIWEGRKLFGASLDSDAAKRCILTDVSSIRTSQNIAAIELRVRDLVERGLAPPLNIALVTSPYHMRRALLMLERFKREKPGLVNGIWPIVAESTLYGKRKWFRPAEVAGVARHQGVDGYLAEYTKVHGGRVIGEF